MRLLFVGAGVVALLTIGFSVFASDDIKFKTLGMIQYYLFRGAVHSHHLLYKSSVCRIKKIVRKRKIIIFYRIQQDQVLNQCF